MLEEKLFFDEFEEEKYVHGKWLVFPVKGVLSPCNDWFQSLAKLPLTNKIFCPNEIASIISEMKWKYYAKALYWREFLLLLLLIGLFLADIFWLHYYEVDSNQKKIAGNIINCIIALLLLQFLITEIKQISYSVSEYFLSWDNYIDLAFVISMSCYIATNISY